MKPIIGITMGDGAGIGPEIVVKALNHPSVYEECAPLVIGDKKSLEKSLDISKLGLKINVIDEVSQGVFSFGTIDVMDLDLLPEDLELGVVSPIAGDAAFQYIVKAVELAKENEIQAICTAPLSKEALHKGGHFYPGHTEILAALTQTEDYSMMLTTPNLRVIHLTTHIGLIDAVKSITPKRTYSVIKLAYDTLRNAGISSPRIAVCGINPHAGEQGLFGYGEEEKQLLPGIEKAQQEGIEVFGPLPADTLFFRAVRGDFDMVVACYHDQGHTPVKAMSIDDGVNITVGLKGGIIRSSVDHGTAFDIAGKNIASEGSLLAALKSAVDLAPKNLP